MLDRRRLPVRRLVRRQQLVPHRGGADVPGRQRVVQQWRTAAPAMRVAVLVHLRAEQQVPVGQVLDEPRIGSLEEHPAHQPDVLLEPAIRHDRVDHRQPVLPARRHVVRPEGWREVHQASPVLGRHKRPGNDSVRVRNLDEVERRLIGRPGQLGSGEAVGDVPPLAEDAREQRIGDDHPITHAGSTGEGVGLARMHGYGGVGNERPRGGRPDQQIGPRQLGWRRRWHRTERESHDHRRVGHGLVDVWLAHLVIGQRGPAARAVGADPVVPDQQALAVDLLQGPPDRLDVTRVHRAVSLGQINPVAHSLGKLRKSVYMPQDGLATAGVKRSYPICLDVALRRQS